MDFVYIWHGVRYWSQNFFGIIHAPAHDLEVKITELEIKVKGSRQNF